MKTTMKRWLTTMLLGIWMITAFCSETVLAVPEDYAELEDELSGPDIHGEGYCVMDADTGEVLLYKNMDYEFYPASITKVMTALVVLEEVSDLDDTLTFSEYAIGSLTSNSSTLSPVAAVEEEMTVRDALYGMMLASANECSTALAEYVAGSEENFAKLMNAKAKELGCTNTHFVNAHGLHDEDHYTTPHDMLLIFQAALENRKFYAIDTTVNYTMAATNMYGERTLRMGHAMVNGDEVGQGVYAGKTGRTYYAGRTLLTAAEYDGRNLLFCVMKSDDYNCYIDTRILMEYAYGLTDGSLPAPFAWNMKTETVTARASVNIREFPSTEALSKGTVPAGEQVTRLGTYGGWSMIKCESGNYYVSSSYLMLVDEDGNEITETETEEETTVPEVTAETEADSSLENSAVESVSGAESVTTLQESLSQSAFEENLLSKAGRLFGNMSNETLTVLMLVFFGTSVVLLLVLIGLLIHWHRKK